MKYTSEIIINKPIAEVINKLDSKENMKHWQRGLVGVEDLEGVPGQVGAKMKINYQMGKRKMEMIETITKNEFPNDFHAIYDVKGVHNIQRNFFEAIDENTTKWTSHSEFQFKSLGMKVFGFLMPGAFKKQSMKYLNDFKNFVEKGISVAENNER